MSAIFGLINLVGRPVMAAELDGMSSALERYGPDAAGTWCDGDIGLGQRLMRFTPEDCLETQPGFSSDRQQVIVSDGRIDNRPELQEELGIEAHSLPDSTFILRAYEKWGADCASHLTGPFAFAICDLRNRTVLLARSRMAERSLFYFESPRAFIFSSAPKGLFSLPFVRRSVDPQSIADFLMLAANEPGSSFFEGISQLRAGETITIERGRIRSRHCRPLNIGREIRFSRDADYVEAFSSLFDRVVADNLRSLTPVGIWLSGGLDSTSIAASAAMQMGRDGRHLQSFTAVPPAGFAGNCASGWYADETPFVEVLAQKYGNLKPHFIRACGSFLDAMDSIFEYAESPILGAVHLPVAKPLQEYASQLNVRVLLTGTPGNFTISYDGERLLAALFEKGRWIEALHQARGLAAADGTPLLKVLTLLGLLPLFPDRLWLKAKQMLARKSGDCDNRLFWEAASPIRAEFLRNERMEERFRDGVCRFRPLAKPVSRADAMLRRADRRGALRRGEEALYGVQNRDLPADARLVEFCLSVPESQYLRNGTSRWLIRRAGIGRLPPTIRENITRGLQTPDWLDSMKEQRGRLEQELRRLELNALAREMIDVPRLRTLVERLPTVVNDSRVQRDYRAILEHGIATGRFLLWAGGA